MPSVQGRNLPLYLIGNQQVIRIENLNIIASAMLHRKVHGCR